MKTWTVSMALIDDDEEVDPKLSESPDTNHVDTTLTHFFFSKLDQLNRFRKIWRTLKQFLLITNTIDWNTIATKRKYFSNKNRNRNYYLSTRTLPKVDL